MSLTADGSRIVARCQAAGLDGQRSTIAVSVEVAIEAWDTVNELLSPFIQTSGPDDEPGQWRLIASVTQGEPADPNLLPYGDYSDTAVWRGVEPQQRIVRLAAASASRYLPVHVVRIVRSLLRLGIAEADPSSVFVHGGMFARDGLGLAVLGGKRSGKTSTVLAAVSGGADFVSNDDLSLHLDPAQLTGAGWPRSVSVRADTFAALGVAIPEQTAHPANSASDRYRDEARLLLPAEIGQRLGAALAPSAAVAGIVFPQFSSEGETSLVELTPAEASSRIQANLLYPPAKDAVLAPRFGPPDRDALARRADQIAATTPAYELRQSLDRVLDSAEVLAKLLEHRRSVIA